MVTSSPMNSRGPFAPSCMRAVQSEGPDLEETEPHDQGQRITTDSTEVLGKRKKCVTKIQKLA